MTIYVLFKKMQFKIFYRFRLTQNGHGYLNIGYALVIIWLFNHWLTYNFFKNYSKL